MSDQWYVPWVPIRSEADLPPIDEPVLLQTEERTLISFRTWNYGQTGWYWYNREGLGIDDGIFVAWAPLPAPYDPDAPEQFDPLPALLLACEVAMEQCGELCQGYDGWQVQMREAVKQAREAMGK